MKLPAYPRPIVSIQTWASSKTKSNAVRASAITKMNVSAKLRPRRPPPSVSRTPKPARIPMQSPGRHASRIVSGLHSDDHGGTPRGQRTARLSTRSHDCERPAGEAPVARTLSPTTKSSSSHPHLDDYGKEAGRG